MKSKKSLPKSKENVQPKERDAKVSSPFTGKDGTMEDYKSNSDKSKVKPKN